MATINQVAKLAGVSRSTVSRYISETGYVSEEARQNIARAVKALNYRPNKVAQSLHTKSSSNIALIISDISNPIAAIYAKGIEEVTFKKNCNLVICNTGFDLEKEVQYVNMLIDKQIDGVIIAPCGKDTNHLKEMIQHNIPIVFFTRRIVGIDTDYVGFDNVDGSFKITEHLLAQRHKRIGAICRDVDYHEKANRLKGYLLALESYKIERQEDLIFYGTANEECGYYGMKQLMKLENPPTAIYTATNLQAAGVIRYCKEHKIKIPNDIAVAAFESFADLDPIIDPPLTANVMPVHEAAVTAANLLFDRIEGLTASNKEVSIKGKLQIRESSMS